MFSSNKSGKYRICSVFLKLHVQKLYLDIAFDRSVQVSKYMHTNHVFWPSKRLYIYGFIALYKWFIIIIIIIITFFALSTLIPEG